MIFVQSLNTKDGAILKQLSLTLQENDHDDYLVVYHEVGDWLCCNVKFLLLNLYLDLILP